MPRFFQALLAFLIGLNAFGPLVMGILDSSFLFLPFGNDLLVIALTARHHASLLLYVLAAACGSTLGVFLLDWIARKAGESGVKKLWGGRRYNYLQTKVAEHGLLLIIVGCLAPPPFPFTIIVAINSALAFPRTKLLLTVLFSRAVRFLILGALAIRFGRWIISVADSTGFRVTMYAVITLCLAGSAFSIYSWIRKTRPGRK